MTSSFSRVVILGARNGLDLGVRGRPLDGNISGSFDEVQLVSVIVIGVLRQRISRRFYWFNDGRLDFNWGLFGWTLPRGVMGAARRSVTVVRVRVTPRQNCTVEGRTLVNVFAVETLRRIGVSSRRLGGADGGGCQRRWVGGVRDRDPESSTLGERSVELLRVGKNRGNSGGGCDFPDVGVAVLSLQLVHLKLNEHMDIHILQFMHKIAK